MISNWTAAPVGNYVHVETADLYRPNARFTTETQGYQVLTPFGKLGYSHKYRSGSPPHQVWNGHRIEIQLRSALQHIWATAVETVDTFTGQALKFIGTGERGWDRFFALTSSAFALEEGRPLVPGTPTTMDEIRQELRLLAESLAVHHTLVGLSVAVREGTTGHEKGAEYFLVFLDPVQRELEIEGFREADLWKAQRAYLARETEITGKPGFPACLVSADSVKALKRAYPNYYLDTNAFRGALDRTLA